jgi:hypothetical protein
MNDLRGTLARSAYLAALAVGMASWGWALFAGVGMLLGL